MEASSKLDLAENYKLNNLLKKRIRYLYNLAFVPSNRYKVIYKSILNLIEKEIPNVLNEFIEYFQKNYGGVLDSNENFIHKPSYPIEQWNVFYRIVNDFSRTNNSVEGWHRSFNNSNEISHPNISRLINVMKDEEEKNRFFIIQSLDGNLKIFKNDVVKNESLKIICKNNSLFDDLTYLNLIEKIYFWKLN